MIQVRSRTRLLVAIAAALALSACGKKEPEPAPAPVAAPKPAAPAPAAVAPVPAPAATPAAEPTQGAPAVNTKVQGVMLGSGKTASGSLTGLATSFTPKDTTIYALVSTLSYSPTPTTLTARWMFEGGQLVNESSQAANVGRNGMATTEFHIQKPDGWPAGHYTLSVMIDGKQAAATTFEVK